MHHILSALGIGATAICVGKMAKTFYKIAPYLTQPNPKYLNGQGRTVIVTGSTDGIGKEYVRWLTQRNYRVLAIGRNPQKLADVVNIQPQLVTAYQMDLASVQMDTQSIDRHWESMKEAVSKSSDTFTLAGFINCVGMAHFSTYRDLPIDQINTINRTNIDSLHLMLQIWAHHSKKDLSPDSFFINISSIASMYPSAYSSVYGATKAYLSSLLDAVGQQDSNTTFLDVKPHYVTTKMVRNLKDWDTASPAQIVQGSMRLLGKRTSGHGCIRHQVLREYIWAVSWWLQRRFKAMVVKAGRIEAMRRKKRE